MCFKCILRAFVSTQLFSKHLSSLRRLLQSTLNYSFFFDLGSYMLLHLSLERIFLAKQRPVFLIKPIWKRLSLFIYVVCMYCYLKCTSSRATTICFLREKWFFSICFPCFDITCLSFLYRSMFCYF